MQGSPIHGRTVGDRYRIGRFLREGRFGRVYEARDDHDGTRVAIKLYDEDLMSDPIAAERFDREVHTLQSFAHPGAPLVIDHGHAESGQAYVVTEWVDGVPLSRAIAQGPLDPERVRAIGVQVALVLAAAHAKRIVHRDLSPDNVFLGEHRGQRDVVKVVDFGLAHWTVPEGAELTAAGTRLGNPTYMAPEYIVDDRDLHPRADLYSLGVVLFEMLTGSPPFVGKRLAVLQAHVRTPAEPPSTRRPEVPRWLDSLVLRLLEKAPGRRPANALAVANALLVGS